MRFPSGLKRLLVCDYERLYLFEVATGKELQCLPVKDTEGNCALFTRDGKYLVYSAWKEIPLLDFR